LRQPVWKRRWRCGRMPKLHFGVPETRVCGILAP
jgi:hypothetical protein